jgi:hypothetical protein
MGYYTDRRLELEGKEPDIRKFLDFLESNRDEQITKEGYNYDHVLRIIDSTDSMKWYEFVTDMTKVSKDWPTIKFIAECKGEDMDCPYRVYFWGGKILEQNSRIIWDDIDLNHIMPLSEKLDKVLEEV